MLRRTHDWRNTVSIIDRDSLKHQIIETYEYEFPTARGAFDEFVTKIIPNIINNAPTIDAVPVVRCKDCCYWNRKYTTVGECEKLADRDQEGGAQFDCDMDDTDFCSYGERK